MAVLKSDLLPIVEETDIVRVRQAVRALALELKFSLVNQTKLITAASELARNTYKHGGGGKVILEVVAEAPRRGIRLTFEDSGPGIADMQLAMTDGYTTGGGLGLGLSGSKRLVSDFEIRSQPGAGTTVIIALWT